MKYPLTFYVNSLPPNVGGRTNMLVIRILEKYRNDEGILEHEKMHVKQWAVASIIGCIIAYMIYPPLAGIGIALHGILYKFIKEYRLWAEVAAYKKQLKYYPDDRALLFAEFISTNYNLPISKENALKLLKE